MAKKINHRGHGGHRELLFSLCSLWFSEPIPEDNKKSRKVVGNLFLVKGEGYDDFIPLFTTSLKSKPETIIIKYKERAQIEQTNKELKSDLNVEGNYYRKKESNHGYIFLVSLVHNIIQHIRLYFGNIKEMSFKDILNAVSMYLLWKTPPKCVFEISEIVKDLSVDAEFS